MDTASNLILQSELGVRNEGNEDQFRQRLTAALQTLIDTDFSKLIQLLYRIDVSEKKLRISLAENPNEQAAEIIADAIIEREKDKARSRAAYRSAQDIPEDDKW